ncbi:hypothetical protein BMS3Abin01_00571 [bacterium BMS3Abin01]|nr:hypothetical protein BMS3Abin01_00571 [bacterium BMS3Abin01]
MADKTRSYNPVKPVRNMGKCAQGNPVVGTQIKTKPIKVLVTTDDYEIEGFMHIKPGGYQSRVSDLLNAKELHYVPITHAVFRKLRHPDEPSRKTATLILRLDTIKMVVPLDAGDDPEF